MSPKISPATRNTNKKVVSAPKRQRKADVKASKPQLKQTSSKESSSLSEIPRKGGRAGKKKVLKGSKTPAVVGLRAGPVSNRPNGRMLGAGGIPRGRPSPALKYPNGSGSSAETIQRRLKAKSPWYQSIVDPLHGADVKIPDSTGFETGTLQLVHRDTIVIPVTANAASGWRVKCPLPNLTGGGPASYNYNATDVTSTVTNVVWSSAEGAFETSSVLRSYSDGVRVVSAALYVESEASLSDNSGIMVGYINPYPDAVFPTQALSEFQNHYKSSTVPVNNNKPIVVRWIPVKQNGGMYDMFYEPTNGAGPASASEVTVPWYEFGVIITGAPSGTTFQVMCVVNYEFIPTENAINILDAKPSPVDAQEIDLVENWVQEVDITTVIPQKQMSSSPSSSNLEEPGQGTGFGMWAETLMEVAPFILGALL
jgi:hypothetical protein